MTWKTFPVSKVLEGFTCIFFFLILFLIYSFIHIHVDGARCVGKRKKMVNKPSKDLVIYIPVEEADIN